MRKMVRHAPFFIDGRVSDLTETMRKPQTRAVFRGITVDCDNSTVELDEKFVKKLEQRLEWSNMAGATTIRWAEHDDLTELVDFMIFQIIT